MDLKGNLNDIFTTDINGYYEFLDLEYYSDYRVTPNKEGNPLNGVSTFDIVLIQQHILGFNRLDSPYKIIAADVNNSGSVTTLDLIAIRRLILSLDQGFSNVPSWKFIKAYFDFPDPENPWLTEFPEYIHFNDLNTSRSNQDFIAIKMGDVNDSANPLE